MWPETANSDGWRSPQAFAGTPKNTREPARSGKKKTPTENGWGFSIGGGGGNRTRVRKPSTASTTCLA